jgi:hypothetical protein
LKLTVGDSRDSTEVVVEGLQNESNAAASRTVSFAPSSTSQPAEVTERLIKAERLSEILELAEGLIEKLKEESKEEYEEEDQEEDPSEDFIERAMIERFHFQPELCPEIRRKHSFSEAKARAQECFEKFRER